MMRIVEVAEFYSPTGGGVKSYIDRKLEAAAQAGHELFVLAPGAEDRFEAKPAGGVVTLRAPALPMDANYRMFWDAAPVHRRLDELKPDLVEASSPWRGAWIAARWPGPAPRAMFVHADPVASYPHRWLGPIASPERIDRLFGWFWAYLRRLTGRFESVVAGSDWLARRLEGHGVGPVQSVAMGVDRALFSPSLRDPALRERLLADCGIPDRGKLLVGVGRFHPEKRWPVVIAGAAAAAGPDLPIGLVIVGEGLDRARVHRAAAAAPHVRLLPPTRDRRWLAGLLASADALIHGGDSETFGLVPAEAVASGTAIIVPDRGGAGQLARPGAAEVYHAADPAAAAAAIRRLFARDPAALRTATLAAAADSRSDAQHYDGLFDHYGRIAASGR